MDKIEGLWIQKFEFATYGHVMCGYEEKWLYEYLEIESVSENLIQFKGYHKKSIIHKSPSDNEFVFIHNKNLNGDSGQKDTIHRVIPLLADNYHKVKEEKIVANENRIKAGATSRFDFLDLD